MEPEQASKAPSTTTLDAADTSLTQTDPGGWRLGSLLAIAGLLVVLFTLNDPGLTVDEPINVGHGVQMVTLLLHDPAGLVDYQKGKPDHPPLARMLIGVSHHLLAGRTQPGEMFPVLGRPASAVAFAVLILLCTRLGCQLSGTIAGWASGLSMLLMPRLFAHAHLASPEVISSAFCLAAVHSAAWAFSPQNAGWKAWLRVAVAGTILGLALLTKLTAVLVPLGVGIAVVTYYWHRRLPTLLLWGAVGGLVFVAGWPWLWPTAAHGGLAGTVERIGQFLSVGMDRVTVYTWYFGRQYPSDDAQVPWHYVWVYFFVTVPILLQAIGLFAGLPTMWQRLRCFDCWTLLVTLLAVLLFFTLPIDRYDGERLFLLAFPLWAVCIGVGVERVNQFLCRWASKRVSCALVAIVFISQAYGVWHYHPFQLSYYNLAVGGLRGAESLGLETTYWGDSLTTTFLDRFAEQADDRDCGVLLPTLYAGHAYLLNSPQMLQRRVRIAPSDPSENQNCRWAIVFRRQSYLQDQQSQELLQTGEPVLENAVDGVWLTRVYRTSKSDANR